MLADAQYRRLNRWLDDTPEEVFAQTPLLITTKALSAIDLGKNVDIHDSAMKARQILETGQLEDPFRSILKGEVYFLEGLINTIMNNAVQGLSLGQEALENIPENAETIRALCLMSVCTCYQMLGDARQAVLLIQETLSHFPHTPNMKAKLHLSSCYVHYLDANLESVKRSAMEGLGLLEGLPFSHTKAYLDYFLGLSLYLQHDINAAQSVLQNILDSRYTANPTYVVEAGALMAYCRLYLADEDGAVDVLEDIKRYCRTENHARGQDILRAFEVEFALCRGKIIQACSMAKAVNFDIRAPRWFFYVPQLTYIKCLMAQGTDADMTEAQTLLMSLDEEMRQINRINVRIEVLILLVVLHQMQKEEESALTHLTVVLDLAEPGGWIQSFVNAGLPMMAMVEHFLKRDPVHEFAKIILAAFYKENTTSQATRTDKNIQISLQLQNEILTRRETELLPLLAQGLSNKEVAETFSISEGTVKSHLKNMFRKLKVASRIEAVNTARRMGILRLD